jgi:hypothetical protein
MTSMSRSAFLPTFFCSLAHCGRPPSAVLSVRRCGRARGRYAILPPQKLVDPVSSASIQKLIGMLSFGDRRVHVEDIPWYVVVPATYAIVLLIGFLFEQEPALKMQPAGHTFGPGQPKCAIFRSLELRQLGPVLNFSFALSARMEISVAQSLRSLRVRVSVPGAGAEVLRLADASSSGFLNKTAVFAAFTAGVGGANATVDVFCSDSLLATFSLTLPADPPADFAWSFLAPNSVTFVCVQAATVHLFTKRAVAPARISGLRTDFERTAMEPVPPTVVQRLLQLKLPAVLHGFVGDVAAGVLLATALNNGSGLLLYGNPALAKDISSVHGGCMDSRSASLCVNRFDHGIELKPLSEFVLSDFRMVRSFLSRTAASNRVRFLVTLEGQPLELTGAADGNPFVEIRLSEVGVKALPFVFNDAEQLVLPFQAPPGLLAFVQSFTRVVIVRPEGFVCESELERMVKRTGLAFKFVNASLVPNTGCEFACECIRDVKYRIELSELLRAC